MTKVYENREQLRIGAVYRCMDRYGLGKARAIDLLKARGVKHAAAMVELWLEFPLSPRGRKNRAHWRASMSA